jgi:prefoldin subunit 5
LIVESVVASVVDKALEAVLRKVGEGKKLSTEDLVVLMLGLFQEIRKDVTETNKRIDAINDSLSRRIEETNKRIDETNKRIDTLYDLLGKIYQTLIKQETTQRQ